MSPVTLPLVMGEPIVHLNVAFSPSNQITTFTLLLLYWNVTVLFAPSVFTLIWSTGFLRSLLNICVKKMRMMIFIAPASLSQVSGGVLRGGSLPLGLCPIFHLHFLL